MPRALTIAIAIAVAGAACHLDAPLAGGCRTDNDCVGGNHCIASLCRPQASQGMVNDPTGGSRAPNETPSGDAAAPDDGGLDSADPDAVIVVGDGPIASPPDGTIVLPPDAAMTVPPDAAMTSPPDAAVPAPDAHAMPPDVAVMHPDVTVTPPDTAPMMMMGRLPDALPAMGGDPCCVVPGLCGGPAVTSKSTGQVTLPAATDVVPLCQGWVLVGDRTANKVVAHNVFNGMDKASYQLTTAPRKLLLDADRHLIIVSFGGATTSLAKIALDTGTVTPIVVSAPVKDLTLSGSGQILALTGTDDYWAKNLEIIDEGTGTGAVITASRQTSGTLDNFSTLIGYRAATSQLFLAVSDLSPGGLDEATLDWNTLTITPGTGIWDDGSNCQRLTLSPDGLHVAVACGSGNGPNTHYTIFDRSTDNINNVLGEWMTGAYPIGGDFTRDGKYFVASDTKSILVFSTTTHARVASTPTTACEYGMIELVRASPDSAFAYALSPCGYPPADAATLSWAQLP